MLLCAFVFSSLFVSKGGREWAGSPVNLQTLTVCTCEKTIQVVQLGMHPYGCRVIQRILEHCPHSQVAGMLQDIVTRCRELVLDQYGNYVVQVREWACVLSRTRTHTLSLALPFFLALFCSVFLYVSCSVCLCFACALPCSDFLSHTLSHPLARFLSLVHWRALSLSCSHALSHTRTLSLALVLTLSLKTNKRPSILHLMRSCARFLSLIHTARTRARRIQRQTSDPAAATRAYCRHVAAQVCQQRRRKIATALRFGYAQYDAE